MGRLEIRIALRALARRPGIAMVAILALGLGTGLPAAMFSLVRGVALRGLPVEDGRRILHLERRPVGARGEGWGVLPRDFLAWREQQRSFEGLAATSITSVAFRVEGRTDRRSAAKMSANAFDLLRVRPSAGRAFEPGDDVAGASPVVVLSHEVWRDRLGADPGAIGRTVWVEGEARTVVGVMPEGFRFPLNEELWLPFVIEAGAEAEAFHAPFYVFGRLGPGTSLADAESEFALLAARLAERYPDTNTDMGVAVKPFTERHLGETPMATMWVMLGAVLLVLVIACTNVASLLLVRAVHRVRDLAVRAALGAGRGRIVGPLLLESGLLAAAGGALGIGVAAASSRGLRGAFGTERFPYWSDVRIDGAVLLFTLAITGAAALLAGVLPAVKALRADVVATLKDEARGSSSLRIGRVMQGLVVLQIGLSLGLLVATGLLARSVRNVQDVRFGPDTGTIVTARITLPDGYDEARLRRFATSLEAALAADPAASSVSLASTLPATRAGVWRFALDGQSFADPDDMPRARRVSVSPEFFRTFDAALVAGRAFGPGDDEAGAPVAIVNRRFVARYLPGDDAIGQRIRLGTRADGDAWRTIVGVVPDLWVAGLDASGDRNPPGVYVPLGQAPGRTLHVAVSARAPAGSVAQAIRRATAELDADVPVYQVRTMDEVIEDNSWFYGLGVGIVGTCGLAALLLAAIGLYGVIAFSVGRRTREFGIRMAVGARPGAIVSLVLRNAAWQVGAGLVTGFVLAAMIARGVSSLLFLVSPTDPFVFASLGAAMAVVALAATAGPALRAARTDPLAALRAD